MNKEQKAKKTLDEIIIMREKQSKQQRIITTILSWFLLVFAIGLFTLGLVALYRWII